MKPSFFLKKIILLCLFISPAVVSLPAQAQAGTKSDAFTAADFNFKNNTGQAVNSICIELPEGNKISAFKTGGMNGNMLAWQGENSMASPNWSCFKFTTPINNNTSIQSELQKNDKRNIEKKTFSFCWMNNGMQVGPIQQVNFYAYGTLHY